MDIKRILLISLIAVAVIASVSVVSAGLFDGLFGGEQQDNVIEIENITFNTTNTTDFTLYENNSGEGYKCYVSDNCTGNFTVWVLDLNQDTYVYSYLINEKIRPNPSSVVDGYVVYNTMSDIGSQVGEPRYTSYVENKNLNEVIIFVSPDANETVKMVSTLKFN